MNIGSTISDIQEMFETASSIKAKINGGSKSAAKPVKSKNGAADNDKAEYRPGKPAPKTNTKKIDTLELNEDKR